MFKIKGSSIIIGYHLLKLRLANSSEPKENVNIMPTAILKIIMIVSFDCLKIGPQYSQCFKNVLENRTVIFEQFIYN